MMDVRIGTSLHQWSLPIFTANRLFSRKQKVAANIVRKLHFPKCVERYQLGTYSSSAAMSRLCSFRQRSTLFGGTSIQNF